MRLLNSFESGVGIIFSLQFFELVSRVKNRDI